MARGDLYVQGFLVIFFDILGQRESLRKLRAIPRPGDDLTEFINHIKETFGRVDAVRGLFKTYFEQFRSAKVNQNLVVPEKREQFKAALRMEVHLQTFSDTVVVGVPLANQDESCVALNGVHASLMCAGAALLTCLSAHTAARAGIDVGLTAKISGTEIYGPALERAVYLEKLAEYPRLLVGEQAIEFLKSIADQSPKTIFGQLAKDNAGRCLKMITRDTDGRLMLDFLGQQMKADFNCAGHVELMRMAQAFVTSQLKHYQETGNEKLAKRFERLLKYFESRDSIWSAS